MALSLLFSPSFNAKNTQNERGEKEGKMKREGRKEEDRNQKSLSIQTDETETSWDIFVCDIDTARLRSLSLEGQPNQRLFSKESAETAGLHVQVQKPNVTKGNFTVRHGDGITDNEGRKTKKTQRRRKRLCSLAFSS